MTSAVIGPYEVKQPRSSTLFLFCGWKVGLKHLCLLILNLSGNVVDGELWSGSSQVAILKLFHNRKTTVVHPRETWRVQQVNAWNGEVSGADDGSVKQPGLECIFILTNIFGK